MSCHRSTSSHGIRSRSRRAAILLVAVVLVGACTTGREGRFRTYARFDTTYDFEAVETFAFDVKRPGVAESEYGPILEAALREGLVVRGYREVPKDRADVWISYDYGTYSAAQLSGRNTLARQTGDISIWVYDPETGEQVWYGWSETTLTPRDEPEPTIRTAVAAILADRMPEN